jgi:CRISPR-associated protein (TIGR03984 family)
MLMTNTTEKTLYTWSGVIGSSEEALKQCGTGSLMFGFSYTPSQPPSFFKLDSNGDPTDHANAAMQFTAAYELRLFDDTTDFRLRRDGASWRVAVLSEDANSALEVSLKLGKPVTTHAAAVRDHQYLLWGRKPLMNANLNGWTRLTATRIGTLWVPYTLTGQQNGIALTAREYFNVVDDGNVVFIAERLNGFTGFVRKATDQTVEEKTNA